MVDTGQSKNGALRLKPEESSGTSHDKNWRMSSQAERPSLVLQALSGTNLKLCEPKAERCETRVDGQAEANMQVFRRKEMCAVILPYYNICVSKNQNAVQNPTVKPTRHRGKHRAEDKISKNVSHFKK